MSGNDLLLDTNILIYLQDGVEDIDTLLLDKDIYISFVTEMELLYYASASKEQLSAIKSLLEDCFIIEMSQEIKKKAIELRIAKKIKLPDAIVAATSIIYKLPLVTSDKGFKRVEELDLVLVTR